MMQGYCNDSAHSKYTLQTSWSGKMLSQGRNSSNNGNESYGEHRTQPPTTFPSYGHNSSNFNVSDHSFVDNNCLLPTPNSPWRMNSFAYTGMLGMGNYRQYGMMDVPENVRTTSVKEIIYLTEGALFPPIPNAPPPTTRIKPPGCKTIFVGGLPEEITEDLIREIFERCGEIQTIRKRSRQNYCHVRFAKEVSVQIALAFSGYRIKIENKDEAPFTGKLHVDYSQASDDERNYYFELHKKEREIQHERDAEENSRPTTPIQDSQNAILCDKLRDEDSFKETISILINRLDRGNCNKRTSRSFYSMIQSVHSHVKHLMSNKSKYEYEFNKAKLELKKQMQGILIQFNDIQKVFATASTQKVWDHFTKPQRKNITIWKKQIEELRNAHIEEVVNERSEDEMDLSDNDMNENNSVEKSPDCALEQQKIKPEESLSKLREETDALRCQLEASENEKVVLKAELAKKELNERCLINMNHSLQNLKKIWLSQKQSKNETELKDLSACKKRNLDKDDDQECSNLLELNNADLGLGTSVSSTSSLSIIENDAHKDLCARKKRNLDKDDDQECSVLSELDNADIGLGTSISSTLSASIIENDARLVGLISTFLNVHPMGANIDYICSFLCQIDGSVNTRDIEHLMKRFPSVFKEESTGIGASLEKKWTFCGFKSSC